MKLLFRLVMVLIVAPGWADGSPATRFLEAPRLHGASVGLTIAPDNEEEPSIAQLDYLVADKGLYLRLAFLDGPQVGQRVLAKLHDNARYSEFYVYHPLLGMDIVSRAQLNRQFAASGLPLNALIEVLYPQQSGAFDAWSSRMESERLVILGPMDMMGCRNEYYLRKNNFVLPEKLMLCAGHPDRKIQVWLKGERSYRNGRLPGEIHYKDRWGGMGKIILSIDVPQYFENPDRYRKEMLLE